MENTVRALMDAKKSLLEEIAELQASVKGIDAAIKHYGGKAASAPSTPALGGLGKYSGMGCTEAILDYLKEIQPKMIKASDIATRLIAEGVQTKAGDFANTIRGVCSRLVKENRIRSEKLGKTTVFGAIK